MLQLTYISTAVPDLPRTALDAILAVARRNNAAVGITGLLLYDGCRFLQVIEGEAPALHAIYARIKADTRHRAIVEMSTREVTMRAFGNWAMAGHEVARAPGTALVDLVERLTAEVPDPTMKAIFRGFARIRAAA